MSFHICPDEVLPVLAFVAACIAYARGYLSCAWARLRAR